jgi:hypothetical protein
MILKEKPNGMYRATTSVSSANHAAMLMTAGDDEARRKRGVEGQHVDR